MLPIHLMYFMRKSFKELKKHINAQISEVSKKYSKLNSIFHQKYLILDFIFELYGRI